MSELSAEDIASLRASARGAFGGDGDTSRVRALMATADGWDRADWTRLAAELGLPGLMVPVAYGGVGMSARELGIAFEEAGYASVCLPLLSTAGLAVPLLLALGDVDTLAAYGPGIAAGEVTMTVAAAALDDGARGGGALAATRDGERWRVTGTAPYVVDGLTADVLLVIASVADGLGVFLVEDAPSVTRTPLVTLDQTRKIARVDLDGAQASRLATADAVSAIRRAAATSRALLAAEQVGGAQRCLDMTAEYARTRIQFGRAIGSFQAVKQRLADVLIQVESARSAVYAALRAVADDDPELEIASRVAALSATDAFVLASAQAIQLHGGIGFTWEHDAHLFFKRARSSAALLGTESQHVDVIARHLDALDA